MINQCLLTLVISPYPNSKVYINGHLAGKGNIKNYELSDEDNYILHSTIKTVTDNLSEMKFNTAISRLMEFVNYFYEKGITSDISNILTQLLSPLAPHISEEVWAQNNNDSVFTTKWPSYKKEMLIKKTVKIVIQINGKLRGSIEVNKDIDKETILSLSKDNAKILPHIQDKQIIREIYVPGKLVNLVVK